MTRLLPLLLLLIVGCTSAPVGHAPGRAPERIVGYVPTWRALDDIWPHVAARRLTHVNIAFGNPVDGNRPHLDWPDSLLARFVDRAHDADTKVLLSLGGGRGSEEFAERLTPENVEALVDAVIAYVEEHRLDGVDVDVEGRFVGLPGYTAFVLGLQQRLAATDRLLTAAVATWFLDDLPDEALAAFDLVHVMSYDHCGPWKGPCEQATYEQALADLAAVTARGVAAQRITLGVPFYAWCWGERCPAEGLSYRDLLELVPGAARHDWIDEPGLQLTWNGPETLARKVELSRRYGGLMIWEISQDARGPASLLARIAGR